jgi:Fic family protein
MSQQIIVKTQAIFDKLPNYSIIIFPNNTKKVLNFSNINNENDRYKRYLEYVQIYMGNLYEIYRIKINNKTILMVVQDEIEKHPKNLNIWALSVKKKV